MYGQACSPQPCPASFSPLCSSPSQFPHQLSPSISSTVRADLVTGINGFDQRMANTKSKRECCLQIAHLTGICSAKNAGKKRHYCHRNDWEMRERISFTGQARVPCLLPSLGTGFPNKENRKLSTGIINKGEN